MQNIKQYKAIQINQYNQMYEHKKRSTDGNNVLFLLHEQFILLMSCKDWQTLTWLGKFLHKSFDIRNVKMYKSCIPLQKYSIQHADNGIWLYTASS